MKIIFRITLVFILFTFVDIETQGQAINNLPEGEMINLFTDRTLYISGEQIQFAAYLQINENNNSSLSENNADPIKKQQVIVSNIIYVELITPDGEKIIGGKFQGENYYSLGCITIPKDLITGIYYIRAYTKFMRNRGPKFYRYISLKIVNPYKPDIINTNYANTLSRDSIIQEDTLNSSKIISVSIDRKEYSTRDSINVQIKGVDIKNSPLSCLTLTVIPDYSFINCYKIQPEVDNSSIKQFYLPETNGISLTGRLKDSKSEKYLPSTIVNLSVLGDCKDFMAVYTDSIGRFFFKIPEFKGVRDIFLCTETLNDSKSTILIDNDFCQSKVKLPTPPFHLTETERDAAFKLAQNIQIASYYNKKTLLNSSNPANKAFYGLPQENLVFDNYIQLPTIEDYINEIVPTLKIRKHKGTKYFKIFSTQPEMEIFKPLVLLDLVAIDNPEKILSLPPHNISHIETINFPYIKGGITYGGIISIFSKKGDFAGIDLPSSGVFLNFNFLADCTYNSLGESLSNNQPDYRNTILWMPNISLNSHDPKGLSFFTPDAPGEYIVLVRGITNDGKEFACKKSFTVRTRN